MSKNFVSLLLFFSASKTDIIFDTMTSTPTLVISALGPFQLLPNGKPAPRFKYLDARELLVYLLYHTSKDDMGSLRGKTKEEIGSALWGDLSNGQLNARFKARLNDVRRVLGAKDWVLFEDEEYKFNLDYEVRFDLRAFEASLAEAERAQRAGDQQAEQLALEQAIRHVRGDFMQDYHTRRSHNGRRDELEWYLVLQSETQYSYRRALERLAQLELDAAHFESALASLRKLVAIDEYDDNAHAQLMFILALQGKHNHALRHYHVLLKQRPDVPPAPALTALYEKIKRNEKLEPQPVLHPSAPAEERAPNAAPLPIFSPPFQVPADLSLFVGRASQFELLRHQFIAPIANLGSPVPHLDAPRSTLAASRSLYCLVGMGGIGKTSLAIHTAYLVRDQFPDGVLWGNLRDSEPLAILASWERAFGCDFSGLPDLNARAASFRSLMHDKQVLVILDDVVDAADARPLLLNGEHTRTIFTSRSAEIAVALDAQVVEMPVLDAEESADMLTRILGRARVAGQESFAQEICALLGHLPLALDITAHRLLSRPNWTLSYMAGRLRAQMRRLDELQLADRAVRATFVLSWDALSESAQHILAHIGVFNARSFTAPALAAVADVSESIAHETLDALVALSLLSYESQARYRQHPLLADFSREQLGATADGAQRIAQAEARLAHFYLQFATEQRKNYLALEDEWDNLNVGIENAHTQELWQEVIDYGDVLTDAWFARGRFTDARRNYGFVMDGAKALEEQDPYIAASLNWGKACIDQGDYAEAEEHIQHGLQTSREVNDEYGIANALFLLGRVAVQSSRFEQAQVYLQQSQQLREKIGDRAGVAETLHLQARIRSQFYDDEGALQLAQAALAILQELPAGHDLIITYRLLATTASYQHQEELARDFVGKALTLCKKLQDYGEYAAVMYELALMAQQTGQLDAAWEQAQSSLKLTEKMGDRKFQAYIHKLLSRLALELGHYLVAKQEAEKTLALLQDFHDMTTIASMFLLLGDIEKATNQIEHAKLYWMEAINLGTPYKHPIAGIARARLEQL